MPAVHVKENEPFDVALRRFKRSCEKAGVKRNLKKTSRDRNRLKRLY